MTTDVSKQKDTGLRVIKLIARVILFVALIVVVLTLVFVWLMADDFAQPKRRQLQAYHQQILNNAEQEGIVVTLHGCAKGQAPCLLVTQSQVAQPNERGRLIRQQLSKDFHRQLTPYQHNLKQPKGIVMLLHGRHGSKEDLLPVAIRLVASGFVCVLPDLPAHGDSPLIYSKFGTELSTQNPNLINQSLSDARQWLATEHGINTADTLPAFLWGISMGGSYANYTLQQDANKQANQHSNNWQGMIIVSSFARLNPVVEARIQQFIEPLPNFTHQTLQPVLSKTFATFVEWQGGVAPNQINPVDIAKKVTIPVLQFHGNRDQVINIAQGQVLHQSYPLPNAQIPNTQNNQPQLSSINNTTINNKTINHKAIKNKTINNKTWITVNNAGHNNVLTTAYPAYATMADWLLDRVDNKHLTKDNTTPNAYNHK